jgi:hypothetical protein
LKLKWDVKGLILGEFDVIILIYGVWQTRLEYLIGNLISFVPILRNSRFVPWGKNEELKERLGASYSGKEFLEWKRQVEHVTTKQDRVSILLEPNVNIEGFFYLIHYLIVYIFLNTVIIQYLYHNLYHQESPSHKKMEKRKTCCVIL